MMEVFTHTNFQLQLLDLETCLLTNFPIQLPQHLLIAHQILPSRFHKGYCVKIRMLNSFKRFVQEFGIIIPSLPNIAFRIHKPFSKPRHLNMKQRTQQIQKMDSQTKLMLWPLSKHQMIFVQFFGNSNRRIILGDQWNMGKIVSILAVLYYFKYSRVLIITHQAFQIHWRRHLQILNTHMNQNWKIMSRKNSNKAQKAHIINIYTYQQLSLMNVRAIEEDIKAMCWEIVIEDKIFGILENNFYKVYFKLLKINEKIDHIIISQQIKSLCQTKTLIPLLNPKISLEQIYERYGKSLFHETDSDILNKQEFENVVYKHYLFKSSKKQYRPPQIIKQIYVDQYQNCIQQMNDKIQQNQCLEGILGKVKSQISLKYFEYFINSNQSKFYYLIYNLQSTGEYLYATFNRSGLPINIYYKDQIMLKSQNSPILKIMTIQAAYLQIKKQNKRQPLIYDQSNMVIFCELIHSRDRQKYQKYINKIFLVCNKMLTLILHKQNTKSQTKIPQQIYDLQNKLIRPQIYIEADLFYEQSQSQNYFQIQSECSIREPINNQLQVQNYKQQTIILQNQQLNTQKNGNNYQKLQKPNKQHINTIQIQQHQYQSEMKHHKQLELHQIQSQKKNHKSRPKQSVNHILTVRLRCRQSSLK